MKDEKEEIKPAPLGEGEKDYTDADVAFANSFQRDNKHYIKQESLGESSEEQKLFSPPEEQEELKLLASKICEEVISIERQGEMSFDDMWERRDNQIRKVIELLTRKRD